MAPWALALAGAAGTNPEDNASYSHRSLQSMEFVQDLEQCIRDTAAGVASAFFDWGDNCKPGTYIVDAQAAVYKQTLSPIMEKHGYTGALWCAFFSLRMFHEPGESVLE